MATPPPNVDEEIDLTGDDYFEQQQYDDSPAHADQADDGPSAQASPRATDDAATQGAPPQQPMPQGEAESVDLTREPSCSPVRVAADDGRPAQEKPGPAGGRGSGDQPNAKRHAAGPSSRRPRQLVYILRGVPGSGKSARAYSLRDLLEAKGERVAIHSSNTYLVDRFGQYVCDARRAQKAEESNYRAFCRSLKEAMSVIIVDNPNILRRDFECYVQEATRCGAEVRFEVMHEPTKQFARTCADRNIHGVELPTIAEMLRQFEP